MSLAFAPEGTLYVAYSAFNEVTLKSSMVVMKWEGTEWTTVGEALISDVSSSYPSLGVAPDGTPYAACPDWTLKATRVMKLNGTTWEEVGTPGGFPSQCFSVALAFAPDGAPCVAYEDANTRAATVRKLVGDTWTVLGGAGCSVGQVSAPSLEFGPDGTPWIGYQDVANKNRATVMKLVDPVASVVPPTAGTYTAGDRIDYTVNFTSPVTVDTTAGVPRLMLTVAGASRYAEYVSGSGTAALVFRYTVPSGLDDGDGTVAVARLQLNGGTISWSTTVLTTAIDLNYLGAVSTIALDTVPPSAASVEIESIRASQVTVTMRSNKAGRGFFTLLPGLNATPGTGAQIAAGQSSSGVPASRSGSRLLLADTDGDYTISGLAPGTEYTLCFTAAAGDTPLTVQSLPQAVSFTTNPMSELADGDWIEIATPSGDEGARYLPSLAFGPDGAPYGLYFFLTEEGSRIVALRRFNGSTWEPVGSGGFPIGGSSLRAQSLMFAPDGTPYVMFPDARHGAKATVMRLAGSEWEVVGQPGFSAGTAGELAFAPDNTPYLASVDSANGNRIAVTKFDGHAWVATSAVGSPVTGMEFSALAYAPDGTPCVTYSVEDNGWKATVSKFNGTSWEQVDSAGVQDGEAARVALAFAPNGTPYVGYVYFLDGQTKAAVLRLNGGVWEPVGDMAFADGAVTNLALTIAPDGTPCLAVGMGPGDYERVVMRFDGTSWESLGQAGSFTDRADDYFFDLSLTPIFDPAGGLWLATEHIGSSSTHTTRILKLQPQPLVTRVEVPTNGTYSAGAALSFTVYYSSAITVDATAGTPTLALTIGSTTRQAAYVSGSGTTALLFRYVVQEGDADSDGIALVALALNGGTMIDASTAVSARLALNNAGATDAVRVDAIPPSKSSQAITFAPLSDRWTSDASFAVSATASSGLPVSFAVVSGPATLSGRTITLTGAPGLVTVRATQSGDSNYEAAARVERSFRVRVAPPPVVPPTPNGGDVTLSTGVSGAGCTYQWQCNGANLSGATGSTLELKGLQPTHAGLYSYTVMTPGGTSTRSAPVIIGPSIAGKVEGAAEEVLTDVVHPNRNIYDQLLLNGRAASLTADPGQITRISLIDLSDDIVQVEFSGAGTLSLVMDGAPVPAAAANYNQPGVNYVRGHVGIVITGADETTNVAVFSVGRITAVNQSLFREEVAYDGVANIAFIAIQSTNGKFGGVRTGNVEYFASQGFTGLYAPGVQFVGPVNIGDIQAFDNAQPLLVVGSAPNARIAGGSLAQPNGQPIRVDGLTQLTMAPGQTSQGDALPAQTNQGVLEQDGIDVTDLLVAAP